MGSEMCIRDRFDSFDVAVATYESDGYKAALEILEGGVVRDFRIVEGVD